MVNSEPEQKNPASESGGSEKYIQRSLPDRITHKKVSQFSCGVLLA
jgi:hypothetical protein